MNKNTPYRFAIGDYFIEIYKPAPNRTSYNPIVVSSPVIDGDVVVKANFEDDMPRGMELAKTLSLTFDLRKLREIDVELYSAVMESGKLPTVYNVGSQDFILYLPVLFKLYDKNNNIIGIFTLNKNTTKSIEVGKTYQYQVELIEFQKFLLENINFDMLYQHLLTNSRIINANKLQPLYKRVLQAKFPLLEMVLGHTSDGYVDFEFTYEHQMFSSISELMSDIYSYFYSYEYTQIHVSNLFEFSKFYKNAYSSQNNRGDELGALLMMVAAYHQQDNARKLIGGLIHRQSDEVVTCWDFLKKLAENNCVRCYFDYSQMKYICDPLLDGTYTKILTKAIDSNIKIELSYKNITKTIVHTKNNEIKSYEYKYGGTLNDASEETDAQFCTLPIFYDAKLTRVGNLYQYNTHDTPAHLLFYGDTTISAMMAVHYTNKIMLTRSGLALDNDYIVSAPLMVLPSGGKYYTAKYPSDIFLNYIRTITEHSYIGSIAKVYSTLFSRTNNAMIELETDALTYNDIGTMVTLDLENILGSNFFENIINNIGIVVGIEHNLMTNRSKCKIFLFGGI